jgi:rRNA biogenesis protein RRP5
MPKRVLDEGASSRKAKKIKFVDGDGGSKLKERHISSSNLTAEDVDFPRGGGSSFTPIEVKAIRTEALREADGELFEVCVSHISPITSHSNSTRALNRPSRRNASRMQRPALLRARKTKYESNI